MPLGFLIGRLLGCACRYYCDAMEDPDRRCSLCNTAYTMRGSVCYSQYLALVSAIILLAAALPTTLDGHALGDIPGFPAPAPQVILWITFVVTILLLFGIPYRCHRVVLVYFVYGVVLILVTLITAICVQAQIDDNSSKFVSKNPYACIYVFIGCGLYAVSLYMVYRAYIKIRTANASEECENLSHIRVAV